MRPFMPYPERGVTMQYCAVPVDVLESASELATWAWRAVQVADRAASQKRGGRDR
jgi:TfoX/Sxy family transcriptional regulator of competence genes